MEPGHHVVARAAAVLRTLAGREPDGATTTEVARETTLARPTVHRLLVSLRAEGLVDREESTGRWLLGAEQYLLGLAAARRYDVADVARPFVEALSRATGESAFFSARRGSETVCLVRQDGSFPLRSHVLHEGVRFPLGVASAGLAILAHCSDREVEEYLAGVALDQDWGSGHAEAALRQRVAATRDAGFAVNPGLIVTGSWGMGAAVFDRDGRPAWALSLTGVEQRFGAERRPELGRTLLDRAHALTEALVRAPR